MSLNLYARKVIREGTTVEYVLIPDLPVGDRDDFDRWLVGKAKPTIPEMAGKQHRCAFYADYLMFLRTRNPENDPTLILQPAERVPIRDFLEAYGYRPPHCYETELKLLVFLETALEDKTPSIQGYVDQLREDYFYLSDHQNRFRWVLAKHTWTGPINTESAVLRLIQRLREYQGKRQLIQLLADTLQDCYNNHRSTPILKLQLIQKLNER